MSHDDFCKCTFGEFESICKAWREMTEGQTRDAWERARTVAAIAIQPHVKKRLTPRQLLPLPWDVAPIKNKPRSKAPEFTAAERRKRFEELVHRYDDLNDKSEYTYLSGSLKCQASYSITIPTKRKA